MTNDERILNLKKQVETKKQSIADRKKAFVPHTNLICDWREKKYNLNVLGINDLLFLAWELSSFNDFCKDRGFTQTISGYTLSDWLTDIDQKISMIYLREEENELKSMENKLNKLLSEDKKTELELNDIEALLK